MYDEILYHGTRESKPCNWWWKRVSSKAIKLRGSLSGTNVFYTLKDCPAALSVGVQVNEHQRPFIWLPNQLPFLVKADRAHEITFFCPESAKIYADRVVENVPILAEKVSGVDMNSNIPLAPASSLRHHHLQVRHRRPRLVVLTTSSLVRISQKGLRVNKRV